MRLLAFAAAAALLLASAATPRCAEPIRIGAMNAVSGPLGIIGLDAINGFSQYLEENGNKMAGRDVVLLKEDDAGIPAQGMERVRRLVEREHVQLLTGITSSAVAYAIRDYVNAHHVPLIVMGSAGANDITDKLASPYIFRTSFSNRQLTGPLGPYACTHMGDRKMVAMASDFVTGQEQAVAFEDSYRQAGCEIVKDIRAPLGTVDFLPFLSQIPSAGVDAVWAMFFAADAVSFVKQYEAAGLKDKLPLLGSAGLVGESVLPQMGEAGLGIVAATYYSPLLDMPGNQHFVASFRTKYGTPPSQNSVSAYVAAMAVGEALRSIDGKIEDTDAFLAALGRIKLETPMGPFRFDDKRNIVFDLYASRVVAEDGKPILKPIERIATDVDQFGAYH
jgi:branched-chain amino acid transport system substrate-binding protein